MRITGDGESTGPVLEPGKKRQFSSAVGSPMGREKKGQNSDDNFNSRQDV